MDTFSPYLGCMHYIAWTHYSFTWGVFTSIIRVLYHTGCGGRLYNTSTLCIPLEYVCCTTQVVGPDCITLVHCILYLYSTCVVPHRLWGQTPSGFNTSTDCQRTVWWWRDPVAAGRLPSCRRTPGPVAAMEGTWSSYTSVNRLTARCRHSVRLVACLGPVLTMDVSL